MRAATTRYSCAVNVCAVEESTVPPTNILYCEGQLSCIKRRSNMQLRTSSSVWEERYFGPTPVTLRRRRISSFCHISVLWNWPNKSNFRPKSNGQTPPWLHWETRSHWRLNPWKSTTPAGSIPYHGVMVVECSECKDWYHAAYVIARKYLADPSLDWYAPNVHKIRQSSFFFFLHYILTTSILS